MAYEEGLRKKRFEEIAQPQGFDGNEEKSMKRIIGIAITTAIAFGVLWVVDANMNPKLVFSDDRKELDESFITMLAREGLPDPRTLLLMNEADLDTAEAEALDVVMLVGGIAAGNSNLGASIWRDFIDGLNYDELRCLARGGKQYRSLSPGSWARPSTFDYCLEWRTNLRRYLLGRPMA